MSAIAQAASVLLVRGGGPGSACLRHAANRDAVDGPLEIYVVRRSESLRFFGGFIAFPGGKIAASDADSRVVPGPAGAPADDAARVVTAVRELFEETGVLIARRADGTFPPSSPDLDRHRRDTVEGVRSFGQVLADLGLNVWASDLAPVGKLVTPAFTATRFDTAFYLASAPPNQRAEVWPGELQDGHWTTPAALLERWERGEYQVSPPSVAILQALRRLSAGEAVGRLAALFQSLNAGRIHPIFFAPAVQLIPLQTQALPPSTHTNAYLIGTGPVLLLDPGPAEAGEQERLFAELDEQASAGRRLTAVVLTHHHPDHVGAANACARRYGVPVWAHARTAEALRGKVAVDCLVGDGDRLDLGATPDGRGPWQLEAVHTPGHAAGHLAFFEPYYRLLLTGDMISTQSSVVIAPPPEGDLIDYLASLRRLLAYPARLLLPAHGGPTSRVRPTIEEALAHRAKREEMLLEALAGGPRTAAELAREVYRGVPDELMRFARWQVIAGLTKLRREGRAVAAGEGEGAEWSAAKA